MSYMQAEIIKYTQDVWASFLDLPAHPMEKPVSARSDFQHAFVQITGTWTGVVMLQCSPDLARRITEKLYSVPPGAVTYQENKDALGELANMVGGNIKSILPQPSYISSPVTDIDKAISVFQGTVQTGTIAFECEGKHFIISVLQGAEYPSLVNKQTS